ncbi:hypothetical protein ACJJIK_02585 [Microbulbifer sp. ZKSA006]|uniref:hypothetical protein n=1 Tax=Microbulbifer sp. ZKSA006 TaxID=3243390 RepID=UPI004039209C
MEWISFNQTGARFSEIPQQVIAGELLTMANRGEPVVDVIPRKVAIKNTMVPKNTLFPLRIWSGIEVLDLI